MTEKTETRRGSRRGPRRVYLVRHAIAAERGREWPDDAKRPLTHKGRARMRLIVRGLSNLGVELEVVLTSPLVRAVQTAELLVGGLQPTPALVETATLAPGEPPASVVRALEPYHRAKAVALVGHEPDLGTLAAWLTEASEPIVFRKGGVCRLDFVALPPEGHGQLIWHATPAMLRALGK